MGNGGVVRRRRRDQDVIAGGSASVRAVAGRSGQVFGTGHDEQRGGAGAVAGSRGGSASRAGGKGGRTAHRLVAAALVWQPELVEQDLRGVVDRRRPGAAGTRSAGSARRLVTAASGTASSRAAGGGGGPFCGPAPGREQSAESRRRCSADDGSSPSPPVRPCRPPRASAARARSWAWEARRGRAWPRGYRPQLRVVPQPLELAVGAHARLG